MPGRGSPGGIARLSRNRTDSIVGHGLSQRHCKIVYMFRDGCSGEPGRHSEPDVATDIIVQARSVGPYDGSSLSRHPSPRSAYEIVKCIAHWRGDLYSQRMNTLAHSALTGTTTKQMISMSIKDTEIIRLPAGPGGR